MGGRHPGAADVHALTPPIIRSLLNSSPFPLMADLNSATSASVCRSTRSALGLVLAGSLGTIGAASSGPSHVWISDNGDGTYTNPILYADYSDPDIVRVNDDFYLTASSFNCVPGLPILHSRDLVNWELIGHALDVVVPEEHFRTPQHTKGVWAPSIRHHDGEYYIFWGDPDFGIYRVKAKEPRGPWSAPLLVKEGRNAGLIDPTPLWDEDGRAYLVHAFAGSRAGIKSLLVVQEMKPDGTGMIGQPVLVFDGHDHHPTVEGPKFYKRGDMYYILAPAGGVTEGWQLALRSENVFGPYEEKVVMHQGATDINGPHQGGLVELDSGESWFAHFQDLGAFGRVVHLNPVHWRDGWPIMGIDLDGDGVGEPVRSHAKPNVGRTCPVTTPPDTDEFSGPQLGRQWQWHANPRPWWAFPHFGKGELRLFAAQLPDNTVSYWDVPHLLLQKFPGPAFTATTKFTFTPLKDGESAGLIVHGAGLRAPFGHQDARRFAARSGDRSRCGSRWRGSGDGNPYGGIPYTLVPRAGRRCGRDPLQFQRRRRDLYPDRRLLHRPPRRLDRRQGRALLFAHHAQQRFRFRRLRLVPLRPLNVCLMRFRSIFPLAVATTILASLALHAASRVSALNFAPVPESVYADVPFAMPRVAVPVIPDRSVSLTEFGAVGDGQFLNTESFARAIEHLASQGGGRLVVPRGIWLTGPIVLRDRINCISSRGPSCASVVTAPFIHSSRPASRAWGRSGASHRSPPRKPPTSPSPVKA